MPTPNAPIIQFKRGAFTNLPGLRSGEPGFTTDKYDLYVGLSSSTGTNQFFGSARYWSREDGSTSARLRLVDKDGTNSIVLKTPNTVSGVTTYTLPTGVSTAGYVLQNDGTGVMSWVPAASTGAISGVTVREEGSTVGTAGSVQSINFVGEGITATASGLGATITVSAASSTQAGVSSFSATDFYFTNTYQVGITTATTSTKGIASFNSTNFTVSSGAVSIANNAIGLGTNTFGQYAKSIIGGNGLTATSANPDDGTDYTIDVGAGSGIAVAADSVALKNAASLTNNVLTKWDSGNTQLTNSIITDNGTGVQIGGGLTVTGTITGTATTAQGLSGTPNIVVGVITATTGIITNISGTGLNYTGVGTITTLNSTTGTVTNISGTGLNYTGVGTITTLNSTTGTVTNISGTGLNYTGVGTITTLNSTTGTVTNISGTGLNYTGVGTIATLSSTSATISQLNVSGVSTFAGIATHTASLFGTQASFTGVVTATSFTGSLTGTASTANTVAVTATNAQTAGLVFATAGTGATLYNDADLTYDSGANRLTATNITASTEVRTASVKAADGASAITITNTTGAVGIASDLTVTGSLYVGGTTTQVNTTSLTVEDRVIELGKIATNATPPSDTTWDLGILFNYYTASSNKKASVYWEGGVSRFLFASDVTESVLGINLADTGAVGLGTTTPQLTSPVFAPIEVGALWANDAAGSSVVVSYLAAASAPDGITSARYLQNIVVDAGFF